MSITKTSTPLSKCCQASTTIVGRTTYYYYCTKCLSACDIIEPVEPCITTFTGKKFHFLNPTEDEICIEDIAHALSLICRFTGHSRVFYSVGEHSLRVAELCPPVVKLSALLHDAAEAYINDIARPVKETHKLRETENKIVALIEKKFNIDTSQYFVKHFDNVLLVTEARDLLPNTNGWDLSRLPEPHPKKIQPWCSEDVESYFLNAFKTFQEYYNRGVYFNG